MAAILPLSKTVVDDKQYQVEYKCPNAELKIVDIVKETQLKPLFPPQVEKMKPGAHFCVSYTHSGQDLKSPQEIEGELKKLECDLYYLKFTLRSLPFNNVNSVAITIIMNELTSSITYKLRITDSITALKKPQAVKKQPLNDYGYIRSYGRSNPSFTKEKSEKAIDGAQLVNLCNFIPLKEALPRLHIAHSHGQTLPTTLEALKVMYDGVEKDLKFIQRTLNSIPQSRKFEHPIRALNRELIEDKALLVKINKAIEKIYPKEEIVHTGDLNGIPNIQCKS